MHTDAVSICKRNILRIRSAKLGDAFLARICVDWQFVFALLLSFFFLFCMWEHAVMSSWGGERPQDSNRKGQRISHTDVLTAQFPWEQIYSTHPPSSPPPPPMLLVAKPWRAHLTLPASSSCPAVPGSLLTSAAAQACLLPSVHMKCLCVCQCVCVCV